MTLLAPFAYNACVTNGLKKIKCKTCRGTGEVPDYRGISKVLRDERLASGLSMREVARRLNFSAPYVSDLEKGKRLWRDDLIKRFREVIKQ